MTPLQSAWFIARADVSYMLKRRETLLWTFVLPIVFFYFIGTVTGGFGSGGAERRDPLTLRGGKDGGFLVDEIVGRLNGQRFDVTRVDGDGPVFQKASRRLTIPDPPAPNRTFTDAVLAGSRQSIVFEH